MAALTKNHIPKNVPAWVIELIKEFAGIPERTNQEANLCELLLTIASKSSRKGAWEAEDEDSKAMTYITNDVRDLQDIRIFEWVAATGVPRPIMLSELWDDRKANPNAKDVFAIVYPHTDSKGVTSYKGYSLSYVYGKVNAAITVAAGKVDGVAATNEMRRKIYEKAQDLIKVLAACLAPEYDFIGAVYPRSKLELRSGGKKYTTAIKKKWFVMFKGYSYPAILVENIEKRQMGAGALAAKWYSKAIQEHDGSKMISALKKMIPKFLHQDVFTKKTITKNKRSIQILELNPEPDAVFTELNLIEGTLNMRPSVRAAYPFRVFRSAKIWADIKARLGTLSEVSSPVAFNGIKIKGIDLKGRGQQFALVWKACYTGTIWFEEKLAEAIGSPYVRKENLDYSDTTQVLDVDLTINMCINTVREVEKDADGDTKLRGQQTGNHLGFRNATEKVRKDSYKKLLSFLDEDSSMQTDEKDRGTKVAEAYGKLTERFENQPIPVINFNWADKTVSNGTYTMPKDSLYFNTETKASTYKPKRKADDEDKMTKGELSSAFKRKKSKSGW